MVEVSIFPPWPVCGARAFSKVNTDGPDPVEGPDESIQRVDRPCSCRVSSDVLADVFRSFSYEKVHTWRVSFFLVRKGRCPREQLGKKMTIHKDVLMIFVWRVVSDGSSHQVAQFVELIAGGESGAGQTC